MPKAASRPSRRHRKPMPPPLRRATAVLLQSWRALRPEERLAFLAGVLTPDERHMLTHLLNAPTPCKTRQPPQRLSPASVSMGGTQCACTCTHCRSMRVT
jgi:hypothetical protein